MRLGTPQFVGERLREAREVRGLTQVALGELLGVTTQAISKYEQGIASPHPDIMDKIPQTLNFPSQFFFSHFIQEEDTLYYRSMSATTIMARKRAKHKFTWVQAVSDYLQEFIDFPPVNFPEGIFPDDPLKITSTMIETAASALRKHWGLKDRPISNVVYLLENNGAVVTRINLDADTLDAFSCWRKNQQRPYFVLGADKNIAARSRLDAAHELGHIILHRHIDPKILNNTRIFKCIENQAFKFAGAFLLPEESFANDFVSVNLNELRSLKMKWNVSMSAMIMRASDLRIISDEQQDRLWRNYSRQGFKKKEPLDNDIEPEKPYLLNKALQMLAKSQDKLQICLSLPFGTSALEEIMGLPRGYFGVNQIGKIIKFKKSKTEEFDAHTNEPVESNVIPFNRKHRG
jgi:Zn-dependent peptidase ImmA (M78 family)/DNA-binding XRE family transcriptional regulator